MPQKPTTPADGKLHGYGPPNYETRGGAVGAIYVDDGTGIEYECVECNLRTGYGFNDISYVWKQRPLSPDWLATDMEVRNQIAKAVNSLPTYEVTYFRISSSLSSFPFGGDVGESHALLDSYSLVDVQYAGDRGNFVITDNSRSFAPLVSKKTASGLECIIMAGSKALGEGDDSGMKWRCKFYAVRISTDTLYIEPMKLYSE